MKNFKIKRIKKLECNLHKSGVTLFCQSESVCLELGSNLLMQVTNKFEN